MWFGKFKKSGQGWLRSKPDPVVIESEAAAVRWQAAATTTENDTMLGGRDWTDLSVLVDRNTPIGRAVRNAQRYFTDAELNDAIHGRSATVILTTVDNEPVFLNAAMMSDVMVGETIDPIAA